MNKPLTNAKAVSANLQRGRHGLGDRLRLVAGIGINVAGATVLLVESLRHSGLSI